MATVRVWDDAHNPYTTGLCALIALAFTIGTICTTPKKEHTKPTPAPSELMGKEGTR